MSSSSFNINKFKNEVLSNGGLSRSNFFSCNFQFSQENAVLPPVLSAWNSTSLQDITCRSTTLPTHTVDSNDLFFHGRQVKIPSNRRHQNLTLTFVNTNNNKVREVLLYWQSALNSPFTNVRNLYGENKEKPTYETQTMSSNRYLYADIKLTHYDIIPDQYSLDITEHKKIAEYKLVQSFPVNINGLTFSHDLEEFQTFSVDFAYQYAEYEFFG